MFALRLDMDRKLYVNYWVNLTVLKVLLSKISSYLYFFFRFFKTWKLKIVSNENEFCVVLVQNDGGGYQLEIMVHGVFSFFFGGVVK